MYDPTTIPSISCRHRACLQIPAKCTSLFFFSTMPLLRRIHLILCLCSAGSFVSTFLVPFLVLPLTFLPKSSFYIFCSGAYLVCFLFKFVSSRRLVLIHRRPELLIYYIVQIFITWHFRKTPLQE